MDQILTVTPCHSHAHPIAWSQFAKHLLTSSNHQLQTSGLRRWKPPAEDPDHGLQQIHDIIERNIEPHPCLPMEPHLFGSVYRHPTTLGVHNLDPHLRSIGKWDRLLKPPSMSKFQCSDSALTPFQTACESWIAAHCAPEFPGLQKSLEKKHPELDWLDLVCPKMMNLLSYTLIYDNDISVHFQRENHCDPLELVSYVQT